jgi:hypothetical protein
LLEALRLELDLLLPDFLDEDLEDAFERDFEAALLPVLLLARVLVFDAAFLLLLLAFDFVDLAAFDDFDFAPAFALLVVLADLPAAFFSAI